MPTFQPPKVSELYKSALQIPPFSTITTTPSNYIPYSDGQGGTFWAPVRINPSATASFSTLAVQNTISSASTFTQFLSAGQGFMSSLFVQSLTVTGSNTFINFGRTFQFGDMIIYGSTFISGATVQVDGDVPAIYTNIQTSSFQTSSLTFTNGAKLTGVASTLTPTSLSTLYYNNATNEMIAGPSGTGGGGSVSSNIGFSNVSILGTLSTSSTFTDYISAGSLNVSTITFSSNLKIDAPEYSAIQIGTGAGETLLGQDSIAIGRYAGLTQNDKSIAIGVAAGVDQFPDAIAIGQNSGAAQKGDAIAIGRLSGTDQASGAIAIGRAAGNASQGGAAVAIGSQAGVQQGENSIAIGNESGATQGANVISIGTNAGVSQNDKSIAIGYAAGYQQTESVAIGSSAGASQNSYAIAVGKSAGAEQSESAIAIGTNAGLNQGQQTIAIGQSAGLAQTQKAIAIGYRAGGLQGSSAVAIGESAGESQGLSAVAIGYLSGVLQDDGAIAFGTYAGYSQSTFSISIGANSGGALNSNAIAIGAFTAGLPEYPVGVNSIVIGAKTGYTQVVGSNTIVLNATGEDLQGPFISGGGYIANSFYVAPVRTQLDVSAPKFSTLYYDNETNEVVAGPVPSGGGGPVSSNLTLQTLEVLSTLTCISSTTLQGPVLVNSFLQLGAAGSFVAPNPISSIYTSETGISDWQSLTAGGFSAGGEGSAIRNLRMLDGFSTIALGSPESVLYRSTPTTFVSSIQTYTLFANRANDAAVTISDTGDVRYIFVGYGNTAPLSVVVADDAFGTNPAEVEQAEFEFGANGIAYNSTLQIAVIVGRVDGSVQDTVSTILYADTSLTDGIKTWSTCIVGGFENASEKSGYGVATGAIGGTEYFVAVGQHSDTTSTIQYSTDGSNWTGVPTGGFKADTGYGKVAYGVIGGQGMFVAVGEGTSAAQTIQYSTDGINFTNVTTGGFQFDDIKTVCIGRNIAYGNGRFIAVGDHIHYNSSIQYSDDGINFRAVEQTVLPPRNETIIASANGVTFDEQLNRWYITTYVPNNSFFQQSYGTTLTSTSVLTENVSANTVFVSTIGFVDTDTQVIQNLYATSDTLYFNGTAVGGATPVDSNIGFSNVGVIDTISSMSTFTEYLSATIIYTSSLKFDSNIFITPTPTTDTAIGIGYNAGLNSFQDTIAIGNYAGTTTQGQFAIAIGKDAGQIGQSENALAIGTGAGASDQESFTVAVGRFAGNTSQQLNSVAVGNSAGVNSLGENSVAIGYCALQNPSFSELGMNNVAIGALASAQPGTFSSTIVLNATGEETNPTSDASFYVAPIRYEATNVSTLNYNPDSKEITFGDPTPLFRFGTGTFVASGAANFSITPAFPTAVASIVCSSCNDPPVLISSSNWQTNSFDVVAAGATDFSWIAIGF